MRGRASEAQPALARRLGFRHEGTLRQEFRTFDGRFVALEYFGLLAEELGRSPEA